MTGFINRLFRRKPQPGEDAANLQPQKQQQGGSFFLDPDESKSFGNIDYMRTSRTVRRTFKGGKEELVEEVSALESRVIENTGRQAAQEDAPVAPTPTETPTPAPQLERRRPSSELDMFRNMAKDLGKKS